MAERDLVKLTWYFSRKKKVFLIRFRKSRFDKQCIYQPTPLDLDTILANDTKKGAKLAAFQVAGANLWTCGCVDYPKMPRVRQGVHDKCVKLIESFYRANPEMPSAFSIPRDRDWRVMEHLFLCGPYANQYRRKRALMKSYPETEDDQAGEPKEPVQPLETQKASQDEPIDRKAAIGLLVDELCSWHLRVADHSDRRASCQLALMIKDYNSKNESIELSFDEKSAIVSAALRRYQLYQIGNDTVKTEELTNNRFIAFNDWKRSSLAHALYSSIFKLDLRPLRAYVLENAMKTVRVDTALKYFLYIIILYLVWPRIRQYLWYPFRPKSWASQYRKRRRSSVWPFLKIIMSVVGSIGFLNLVFQAYTRWRAPNSSTKRKKRKTNQCKDWVDLDYSDEDEDDTDTKRKNWKLHLQRSVTLAEQNHTAPGMTVSVCSRRKDSEMADVADDAEIRRTRKTVICQPKIGALLWGVGFRGLPAQVPRSCECNEYLMLRQRVTRYLTGKAPKPGFTSKWKKVPMPSVGRYLGDEWREHLLPSKRELYDSFREDQISKYTAVMHKSFVKVECNLKTPSKIDPRAIQGTYPLCNAQTGPAVYSFTKQFVKFVNSYSHDTLRYLCPYGFNEEQMSAAIMERLDFEPKCYVEADGKRMDASIAPEINDFMHDLIVPYAANQPLFSMCFKGNRHVVGRTRHGIKYSVGHGLCSGVQWTTINHCVFMWIAAYLHAPDFRILFCNKGDDVWIASSADLETTSAWLFNLEHELREWGLIITKKIVTKPYHSEFLAMRPLFTNGNLYWIPKIGRFLPKLCWAAYPRKCVDHLDRAYSVAQGLRHLRNVPFIGPVVDCLAEVGVHNAKSEINLSEEWKYKSLGSYLPEEEVEAAKQAICDFYEIDATDIENFAEDVERIRGIPYVLDSPVINKLVEKDLGAYDVPDTFIGRIPLRHRGDNTEPSNLFSKGYPFLRKCRNLICLPRYIFPPVPALRSTVLWTRV